MATAPNSALTTGSGIARMGLAARAGCLALALFVEKFLLNFFVDFRNAQAATGLGAALRVAQHFGFRFAVSFAIALILFVPMRTEPQLREIDAAACAEPVRRRWLAVHAVLLICIAGLLHRLFSGEATATAFALLAASTVLATGGAVAALGAGLAPWRLWRRGALAVGHRWTYATGAAVLATAAIVISQDLWAPMAQATFTAVRVLLRPLLPGLQADAATRVLRAPHFAVGVSRLCSGLEGVGLMLAFLAAWLIYFRKEYRFPRALILVPAGVALVLAFNVVRIAALVLIGNAGHPNMAVYGFHSQAGWIAFNCVACGTAWVSRRSRWLNRSAERAQTPRTINAPAAYLMPFLAVLAAGMLSRALSGRFETAYALRLLAGGAALVVYWRRLRGLDWRFGWRGVAGGLAACAIWLGGGQLLLAAHGMPRALEAMSAPGRTLWIASRVLTSVLVVPLAEELAYRGYLLRRLVAQDFESVHFASVGVIPLLVSALVFGLLHGVLWIPALGAGVIYGALLIRTGRMGEAVTAHVISSLLLAGFVLLGHQWQYW